MSSIILRDLDREFRIRLGWSLAENGAANTYFTAARRHRTRKVIAHTHTQFKRLCQPESLSYKVSLLSQGHEVGVFCGIVHGHGLAPSNGPDCHEAK